MKPLPVPDELRTEKNRAVLGFVETLSAHSAVGSALIDSLAAVGDAQVFCPDPGNDRYLVVSTRGTIFALAVDGGTVGYRLAPRFHQIALRTGAEPLEAAGLAWVKFELFRSDWPSVDLKFWTLKAYDCARHS